MRTALLVMALALALGVPALRAQPAPARGADLTPEQAARMADLFDTARTEGAVWARITGPLDGLYRELRRKGETRRQALHNLGRIGLPGVDIAEFGAIGEQVRRELDAIAQHAQRRQGLGDAAAAAVTALAFRDVLQTLVAVEPPSRIHLAVTGPDGNASPRRSESLYDGPRARLTTAFDERIDAARGPDCRVDTLRLSDEVYFTVTCHGRGPGSYPQATAKSECSINDDRMRPLRLTLQSAEADPPRELLVWCSAEPR